MLEDHEGPEVMKMGQMRLWITTSQSVLHILGVYRALKHILRIETFKTRDLVRERKYKP